MLKLGNTDITLTQLVLLGAEIKQEETITSLYSNTPFSQADLDTALKNKQITIRAEYWISWLFQTYETMNSPQELSWLIAAAEYLPFTRVKEELIHRTQEAIKLLKELNIDEDYSSTDFKYYWLNYWLKKILANNKATPWVAYNEEQYIEKIANDIEADENPFNIDIEKDSINPNYQKIDNIFYHDKNPKHYLSKRLLFRVLEGNFKFLKTALNIICSSKGCFLEYISISKEIIFKKKVALTVLPPKSNFIAYRKAILGPSLLVTMWDVYGASHTLANPQRTDKETRDSIAIFIFTGGELGTTLLATGLAATAGVNFLAAVSWLVISFTYSGFSLLYEYKDANLSWLERYNTFSRGFWQLDLHPTIQEYLNHKQFVDELAKNYYLTLKKEPNICFIFGSIGQYNTNLLSFEEFVTKQHGLGIFRVVKLLKNYSNAGPNRINKLKQLTRNPKNRAPLTKGIAAYEKEYEIYLATNSILPTSVKIALEKNELKKQSRLTPAKPGPDAIISCAPTPREGEPTSTATYANSPWDCENSFMVAISRQKNPLEGCTGIFDLSLAQSGLVILDKETIEFKNKFYIQLGNNSTVEVITPSNSSSENIFIFPKEGFSCILKGYPGFSYMRNKMSTIYMS